MRTVFVTSCNVVYYHRNSILEISAPTSQHTPITMAGILGDKAQCFRIPSVLSLELRLRWLEAILLGVRQDAKDRSKGKEKLNELKQGDTLIRLAEDIQRRFDIAVQGNDGLKRFMDHCVSLPLNHFQLFN